MREARHLGQVSDAQHLAFLAELGKPQADHFGDAAADARVDLVEDHRRDRAAVARNHLDREAHTGELAA